jgi:prepilin-type N-terminal cleavage/methylation domain-containing protein
VSPASSPPNADADAGFTLVEVLVSIAILGIIMVVLCTAVMMGLRSTKDASVKFDQSNAAEFTALHFTADVQGAELVSVDDVAASCGGAAELKLTSPIANRTVAYAVTGSPLQLVRRECSPSGATPSVTILASPISAASDVVAANTGGQVTLSVNQPSSSLGAGFNFTVAATSRISP